MSKKVLGNKDSGLVFIISGPAGTGKSTLVEMLHKEFPHAIAESCSVTTRLPRPGEIAQRHYEFVTLEEFEKRIENHAFLEYARVFGDYYGTPKEEIERLRKTGKHIVMVIDTQGAMQLKQKMPVVLIFVSPPSFDELRRRLFHRKTESEEKMQERLLWAKQEIAVAPEFDYYIENDDLKITYGILRSILIAEEHRRSMDGKKYNNE